MKGIKIGKLRISWKAFYLILFGLFIDGMIIGSLVASNQLSLKESNVLILFVLLILPFVILFKSIRTNIHSEK